MNPERAGTFLYSLLLLWLGGVAIRLTVLAVPPVIPLMHADLELSQTDIGILSSLPPLVFAAAAIPGSALIARFGTVWTLVAGLLLAGLASALRGAAPDAWLLFATTIVMSMGIAVVQPALPPLVRDWAPHRIGLATAVYANGMLIGETLPVAITLPLVAPWVGGSWRWTMVVWALPVVLVAWLFLLRRRIMSLPRAGAGNAAPRRWWPDWRDAMTWKLGLALGGGGAGLYFGSNAFLPDHLTAMGQPGMITPALTSLNLTQLLASAILLAWARQLTGKRWPFVAIALLGAASVTGLMFSTGPWLILLWSGVIGFCSAAMMILVLALPPLLTAPEDVHRMSAAIFTLSYSCALLMPVLGGVGWDLSGNSLSAFVPLVLFSLLSAALGASLKFDRLSTGGGR